MGKEGISLKVRYLYPVERMNMSAEAAAINITWLDDFKAITKMRLALSVVFSSIAGYFLAADTINYIDLALLAAGGYCLVGASNAFNQVIEKDLDALMQRTKNRPLPSGRMLPFKALGLAIGMTILGLILLYLLNWRTAFFWEHFHFFICSPLHSPKNKNASSCFCRCLSWSNTFYARLGRIYELFWYRTWRIIYVAILLAVSPFLGHCVDAR